MNVKYFNGKHDREKIEENEKKRIIGQKSVLFFFKLTEKMDMHS